MVILLNTAVLIDANSIYSGNAIHLFLKSCFLLEMNESAINIFQLCHHPENIVFLRKNSALY